MFLSGAEDDWLSWTANEKSLKFKVMTESWVADSAIEQGEQNAVSKLMVKLAGWVRLLIVASFSPFLTLPYFQ